jgi:hypothetical protein
VLARARRHERPAGRTTTPEEAVVTSNPSFAANFITIAETKAAFKGMPERNHKKHIRHKKVVILVLFAPLVVSSSEVSGSAK